MKLVKHLVLFLAIVLGPTSSPVTANDEGHAIPQNLKIAALLTSLLEQSPGTEVMISHVALPLNTTLPRHWHPGEEFAYLIQGNLKLMVNDEENLQISAGDVAKVPYKRIHTIATGDEGAIPIVFRVHENGQPKRVLVDQIKINRRADRAGELDATFGIRNTESGVCFLSKYRYHGQNFFTSPRAWSAT